MAIYSVDEWKREIRQTLDFHDRGIINLRELVWAVYNLAMLYWERRDEL